MARFNPAHAVASLGQRLSPFHAGFAGWLAFVTFFAGMFAFLFRGKPCPSADLMQAIAQIAATLLVGWVVEAVWMTTRVERDGDDREHWLGATTGFGTCGLVGLAAALLVAAHREAGHSNLLDWFGFWWAVISISFLGVLLVLHPLIVERWKSDRTDA